MYRISFHTPDMGWYEVVRYVCEWFVSALSVDVRYVYVFVCVWWRVRCSLSSTGYVWYVMCVRRSFQYVGCGVMWNCAVRRVFGVSFGVSYVHQVCEPNVLL